MRRVTDLLLCMAAVWSADWPSFRGPNGSGVAAGPAIPADFGPERHVIWKVRTPKGSSSPVIAGDSLYLTGFGEGKLFTLKIDRRSGRTLWTRTLDQPRSEARHQLNNPASPTPVTDGKNVYVFFSDIGLLSYGPDGEERWRLPFPPFQNFHGMGASPVYADGKIVLICDQDTESFVLAVDAKTGKQLWKTVRPAAVHGFATANIFQAPNGQKQVIVPGSYFLAGYSLTDGKELWSVRGLSWQIKASAVVQGDTIYATGWAPGADPGQAKPIPAFADAVKQADKNGDGKLSNDELPQEWKHGGSWTAIDLDRDGGLDGREWGFYRGRRAATNVTMAVRPGNARGDLTDTNVIWKHQRMVPEVPSPLLLDGLLFTVKGGGILTAMDAGTGEVRKSARMPGAIDAYYASPVAAGGLIYLFSEQGKAVTVKAGREWEVQAVSDFEEPIYATPAVGDGRMYLRTASALYCFGAAEQ